MVNENKDLAKIFVEIVLEASNENYLIANKKAIIEILEAIDSQKSPSPYDAITLYIFEKGIENPDELIALFDVTQKLYEDDIPDDISLHPNIDLFFKSINRHIRLAVIQQEYIKKNSLEALKISKEAEDKILNLEEKIKEATDKLSDAELQIDKMEQVKGSIYTEFIAILGIFSALIFGLFGGFDGLSEAIVSLGSKWSMGRMLIISSGIMLSLTLLIFGLLQWVARITDRKLTSCDCYKRGLPCEHSLFQRHRTLFSLVLSFIFVFLIGEYIESYENIAGIDVFQATHQYLFKVLAWGIPIVMIIMIIFVLYEVFKKPDFNLFKTFRKQK
ncbi:hypothetical protein [Candidatus Enterococcus courvalinii]|uniref:Uncharacterized protein n=1 Tax=Candidatus Enterococcus courvalinii TaxID=2815329 RepID=A0ABS3HZC8_9ENTE|nr:hypothetical protein [Enterococcus sp. MSG2901]MBO0481819.1 hypothetical protein [Enterococcus sp. MSG2901]